MESAQATEGTSRTDILKHVSLFCLVFIDYIPNDWSFSNSSSCVKKRLWNPAPSLANTSHNSRSLRIRGNHSFRMRGTLLDGSIVLLRGKRWLCMAASGDLMHEFLLLFIDFLLDRLDLYFRFNIVWFFFLFSFGNLVGVFLNTFSFSESWLCREYSIFGHHVISCDASRIPDFSLLFSLSNDL